MDCKQAREILKDSTGKYSPQENSEAMNHMEKCPSCSKWMQKELKREGIE
jgi:hypothetical protein